MGVSNVDNLNKANLVKLALTKKAGQSADAKKPTYLQMTGSIFNAPGVKDSQSTPNIVGLNTRASLANLNKPPITRAQGSGSNSNPDDIGNIDNASDGRAAIAKGENMHGTVKSYTKEVQNKQKIVNSYSLEGNRLKSDTIKNNKSFAARIKADENAIKKDNDKIQRLVKENEETQKEVENAQRELDSLMASNSFSINNGSGGGKNQDKINKLQTLIGSKVSGMQQNGKVIYSLQRSSSKSLSRMNRTNNQYINIQKTNQKAVQNNQQDTNKTIKVANEIEKYSALASTIGQTINTVGQALVAIGEGTSVISFGGSSALIAVGTVMQKVGTVLNTAGQYGQTAANLTKGVAYAAEGNLQGAMQSLVSAAQTGATAVKSTMNLKSDFGKIDAQANQANKNLETVRDANAQTKQLQNEGMAKLANEEQIQAFTGSDGKIDYKGLEKDLKNKGVSGKDIKNAKNNAGTVKTKTSSSIDLGKAFDSLSKGFMSVASAFGSMNSMGSMGMTDNGLYPTNGSRANGTGSTWKSRNKQALQDLNNIRHRHKTRRS